MSTAKTIYQMKVTLIGSKPPIWRRFLVEDTITLGKLHDILQIVMGWTNSHLHHFIIDNEFYGMPLDDDFGDMRTKDETRFKLNQLVSGKGFKFGYEYDFGDSWEHDLVIEKILPSERGARPARSRPPRSPSTARPSGRRPRRRSRKRSRPST